jgi:YHS domain-containing protein
MLKQFVFLLAFILSAGAIGFAQEKPKDGLKDPHQKSDTVKVQKVDEKKGTASKEPWNKVCPVKGNPIEADSPTVEFNGKVYAFCCPGCDTKFAKNPEKYAKNLSEDGKKFVGRK